jgi:hypothetical protein
MQAVRGEMFTYESSASTRASGEAQTYVHGVMRQGHTERGQMLGADVGPASGSASELAYDRYNPSGRFTAFIRRQVMHEQRWPAVYHRGPALFRAVDVMNSIGGEVNRFVGPLEVLARITLTADLNRYFVSDENNANFAFQVKRGF